MLKWTSYLGAVCWSLTAVILHHVTMDTRAQQQQHDDLVERMSWSRQNSWQARHLTVTSAAAYMLDQLVNSAGCWWRNQQLDDSVTSRCWRHHQQCRRVGQPWWWMNVPGSAAARAYTCRSTCSGIAINAVALVTWARGRQEIVVTNKRWRACVLGGASDAAAIGRRPRPALPCPADLPTCLLHHNDNN